MDNRIILAAIIVIIIIIIAYVALRRGKEKLIIKPDDSQIPIIRMLKNSFWAETGETPMLFKLLTESKLRWYGLTDTDTEMHYEVIDPLTMVIHTPGLDDYYKAPNYYRLEAINENTIKMTMLKGLAHSAPLYLHKTSPIKTFLNETY